MPELATIDQQFDHLRDQLFNTKTRSTLNPGFGVVSMSGPSPVLVEASTAREITAICKDLGGSAVSSEMEEALSGGHYTGTDNVPLVDMPKLLKEIYPLGSFFQGETELSGEAVRLAANLETWAVKHGYSLDSRIVPTDGDVHIHHKARTLVDSVTKRSDIGRILRSPFGYEGVDTEGTPVSYDADLHPRSSALYAALTTASLEEQVAVADRLDQLVWDIHDHPNVPVLGTSVQKDGWDQQHSFMVKARSPRVSLGYHRNGGITIPMATEQYAPNLPCANAIHRNDGRVDVYDMVPLDPLLYDSSFDFGYRSSDLPLDASVARSDAPFVSAMRLMDSDTEYNERYHGLFRHMLPVYIGGVAKHEGHPNYQQIADGAKDETKRSLKQPFNRAKQIEEVTRFVRFVTRNAAPTAV